MQGWVKIMDIQKKWIVDSSTKRDQAFIFHRYPPCFTHTHIQMKHKHRHWRYHIAKLNLHVGLPNPENRGSCCQGQMNLTHNFVEKSRSQIHPNTGCASHG